MPPKSNKKTGLKGPPNEIYYEDHQVTDQVVAASLRLEALKRAYVDRMELAARKQQHVIELQEELKRAQEVLEDKNEERQAVLTDCTRQYKTDEGNKIAELASLDARLNRLQEEHLRVEKETIDCEASYDKKIKEKRMQIVAIAQRTAEMEKEFAAMLNDVHQSIEAI